MLFADAKILFDYQTLLHLKINNNSLISLTMALNGLKVLLSDVEKAKLTPLVSVMVFSELVVREQS